MTNINQSNNNTVDMDTSPDEAFISKEHAESEVSMYLNQENSVKFVHKTKW